MIPAPTPHVIAGPRTLERLSEVASGRVFLVTDAGLAEAGHLARAERILGKAGAEITVYDAVRSNPTPDDVDACLAAAKAAGKIDIIVALGGGSVIDTAKAVNVLLASGGQATDLHGTGDAGRAVPLVAIPTTAGTGTESQASALLSDPVTRVKTVCMHPGLAADVVILDAKLTLTQPRAVAAACGLDALTHAVETAVSKAATPVSRPLSQRAFVACWSALPRVLDSPDNLRARGKLLRGAHEAGAAIANSMLGAAHATGNALTAAHGIPHGYAVGLMLAAVVRFNAVNRDAHSTYLDLAESVGLDSVDELIEGIELRVANAGAEAPTDFDVSTLVRLAGEQLTGGFNPRPLDVYALHEIFQDALR